MFLKASLDRHIFSFVDAIKKKFTQSKVLSAQERVTGNCILGVESTSGLKSIYRTKWNCRTRNGDISPTQLWQWLTEKKYLTLCGIVLFLNKLLQKEIKKNNSLWKFTSKILHYKIPFYQIFFIIFFLMECIFYSF